MITNQKLKKSLEEIKNITSFDAILYSAKGKHLTGTVEEPEHSDIFVKEFIVSEEDVTITHLIPLCRHRKKI